MYQEFATPVGRRVVAVWGHYAPELMMASIAAITALGLFPPPGLFMYTLPLAVFAFVLATWLMLRAHDRRLCEHCVSSMPLNPSETAARYKRRFWVAHNGTEARYVIPYLAFLVAANFVPGTVGRLVWVSAQASLIYLLAVYTTHRRLQPWCPWCKGGHGEDEDVDTPDPIVPESRDLLV
jgi:hypothetical protein